MPQGFYYDVYPAFRIGGGPEPEVYSVEQQNLDAFIASQRVKATNQRITQAFMALGAWGPVNVSSTPAENGSGAVINTYA